VQVRAACHQRRFGAVLGQQRGRLGGRARRQVAEPGQTHHRPLPPTYVVYVAGSGTWSGSGIPLRHSSGSSGRIGSGNCTVGTRSGPKRGSWPSAPRSSAFSTFSGVIGSSSTRTPTASNTAFATAGGTGSSGPWPASFAPNGPSGSFDSIRIVSTGGISSELGLLYSSIEGDLCSPRRKVCSSMRISPSAMYTLPSVWPSTSSGLIARPMSWAIQILSTRTSPVSGSVVTSTTQAANVYDGLGPTVEAL